MDQYIYTWHMIVCLDVHRSNSQLEPMWHNMNIWRIIKIYLGHPIRQYVACQHLI